MFERLLERLALAFDGIGLPYMIIGGQAVLLYGEPRLTKDIDLTIGADLARLPDILQLIQRIELKPLVDPETFTKQTMVLPCVDPASGIRVDVIFSFTPYEQQALARVKVVRMGKADVRFASLEDLLVHKIIAGRPRDLEDARTVLIKNPRADLAYMRRWLGEFSATAGEPLLARFDQIVKATKPNTG